MKKIVLYTIGVSGPGGAERLLWEEEKYFSQKGIKTIVLTFFLDKKALYDYKPKNIVIMKRGSFRIERLLMLRRTLLKIKPDIVIGQHIRDCNYLYFATLFTPIHYMVHIHGTFFWFPDDLLKYCMIFRGVFREIRESVAGHKEFIPPRPQWNFKNRMVSEVKAIVNYLGVRKARAHIVLTDQVSWEVKILYKKDSVVARGCLPPEVLSYRPREDIRKELGLEGKKIIFNVGRLDPRKRIDVLIKSYAKILPEYDDLYLLIGGTGEDQKRLKLLVKELGLEGKVIFCGFIPDAQLFDYYAACDVFVFPSWTTSGISPYEALAVGKKVVITSEADEPFLQDKHVFLADPNVEDFAKKLHIALNTDVSGKIDLSDYTWDKYFETVYIAACRVVQG